jgi:DNA-binding protein H-NS
MLESELDNQAPSIVAQPSEGKCSLADAANLASMSVDELWYCRELIEAALLPKIASELANLEERLEQLNSGHTPRKRFSGNNQNPVAAGRRPYPSVLPKYRNPKKPSETWSGRGRRPRWVQAQLGSGKRLEDFLIA